VTLADLSEQGLLRQSVRMEGGLLDRMRGLRRFARLRDAYGVGVVVGWNKTRRG